MKNEFTAYGHVNSEGEFKLYDAEHFWKRIATSFSATNIEIVIREGHNEFSDGMRGYYYGIIVPEVQKAFEASGVIKSKKEIDYDLRDLFLYTETWNEEKGEFEKEYHTLRKDETKVDGKMMKGYCEKCIIWCITNLDWAIPYPNEVFTFQDMADQQRTAESARILDPKSM